jgi:hypothetical protein
MVSLTPLPFGKEIQGLEPSPITKMLVTLLHKEKIELSRESDVIEYDNFLPGGKGPVQDVLDVYDIEPSDMSFTVSDGTNTTHVTTTSDDDDISGIKLDEASHLALVNVELDGVVGTDFGIGISDSASIIGNNKRNTLITDLEPFN